MNREQSQLKEFSNQDLQLILKRASTLYERLSQSRPAPPSQSDEPAIQRRLERWCRMVADSDWQAFEKRLEWDGFNLETIRPYLAPGFTSASSQWPDWLGSLAASSSYALNTYQHSSARNYDFLKPQEVWPFEEIWAPFVEWAWQRLLEQHTPQIDLLSSQAWQDLKRDLLKQLASRSATCLYQKFAAYRDAYRGLSGGNSNTEAKKLYLGFLESFFQAGLPDFFKEYSFLARQVATMINHWIEATGEFLHRLQADLPLLANKFNHRKAPSEIVELKTGLSDRHNRGRSVIVVNFRNKLRLVYKPRPVQPETNFAILLNWINRRAGLLPLRPLVVLDRGEYGWTEFIEHLPCPESESASRFFRRVGMLMALVYTLAGNDCHRGNLIACQEQPVLVDLETLLEPVQLNPGELEVSEQTSRKYSVLDTGFLPVPGAAFDFSGLGEAALFEGDQELQWWQSINTDAMQPLSLPLKPRTRSNLPFTLLNGQKESFKAAGYLEEITGGFEDIYLFIYRNRELFLSENSPIKYFSGQAGRYIFRPTEAYGLLFRKTAKPAFFREGIEAALTWDALARTGLEPDRNHLALSLLREEHLAMTELDFPAFYTLADSRSIYSARGFDLQNFFDLSGYDRIIKNIQKFSLSEMQKQITLIRQSFELKK